LEPLPLINNIADLAIDAYELLRKKFLGSGYDLACAQNNIPIIYQLVNDNQQLKLFLFALIFLINFTSCISTKKSSKSAIATYLQKSWNVSKLFKIDAFNKYCFKCY
jgi:hypothetical protein